MAEQMNAIADPGLRGNLHDLLFEVTGILQETKEGMARIHRIVKDLSWFSHVDDDRSATTDVNATVDSTLSLLKNELRHRATVERDLKATRTVLSSSARLGQVFLNLILNATQALDASVPRCCPASSILSSPPNRGAWGPAWDCPSRTGSSVPWAERSPSIRR
jgi:signal transduction histidine kinase